MSQSTLLFQALSLDSFVLESLLKRHRNSHGRTLYFRRMSMVVQAMRRWQPLRLEQEVNALTEQNKKKKAEEWILRKDTQQQQDMDALLHKICHGFPEILSRSLHASAALFTEVNRGFFLPFCTVALGALARISTLLKKLGQLAISQLQVVVSANTTSISLPQEILHTTMETFLESATIESEQFSNGQDEILLASLGIRIPKSDKETHRGTAQGETEHETKKQNNDDKKEPPTQSKQATPKAQEDYDDIGESVVSAAILVKSKPDTTATGKQRGYVDSVDQNSAIVESFKQRETKKKPKKRKDSSSTTKTAGKNKNKKVKKGDFFDSIFD
jgi:hypothetical protein